MGKQKINKQDILIYIFVSIVAFIFIIAAFIGQLERKDIKENQDNKTKENTKTEKIENTIKKEASVIQEKRSKEEVTKTINTAGQTGDYKLCNSGDLIESEKSKCINNANAFNASKENNTTYCEEITDKSWANRCSDNINYENAKKENDDEKCKLINDSNLKVKCVNKILMTKVETNPKDFSEEDCKKLIGENIQQLCISKIEKYGDFLLIKEAYKNQDKSLCEKIKDDKSKNDCLNSIN